MSNNNALKLWQEAINEYSTRNNTKYAIPKKNTDAYSEIKKIYDRKRGQVNKNETKKPETKSKSCSCRCACNCPKPKK